MKIAVFFHNAIMGNYIEVEKEMMDALKESGLLEESDVFVKNDCKDIGLFEFPTLELLDQFAVYHPDYYILYIMNKGVSRKDIKPIQDWRKCMTYWNITKWENCVRKLDEGYDSVGINIIDQPKRHWQGNWWWATAKHIREIGLVRDVKFKYEEKRGITERHKAEFWIIGDKGKVFCPYHHHLDPYQRENPENNYIKLKDNVWNFSS